MNDLKISIDGELQISSTGDLDVVTDDERVAQEVLVRLKTTPGDYVLNPSLGVDLEKYIGQPNNALTCSLIAEEVHAALVSDGLLYYPNISCVPISNNEVLILVEFLSSETETRIIQITAGLDLREGLVYERIDFRTT